MQNSVDKKVMVKEKITFQDISRAYSCGFLTPIQTLTNRYKRRDPTLKSHNVEADIYLCTNARLEVFKIFSVLSLPVLLSRIASCT